MDFPQLSRETTRPEEQKEKEIWQPSWKCFCCQDTGIVNPHLVRLVIPDYSYNHDRLPICQAPGCDQYSRWMGFGNNVETTTLRERVVRVRDRYCVKR